MVLPSKDLNSTKYYSLVYTRVFWFIENHQDSSHLDPKCLNINKTYLILYTKTGAVILPNKLIRIYLSPSVSNYSRLTIVWLICLLSYAKLSPHWVCAAEQYFIGPSDSMPPSLLKLVGAAASASGSRVAIGELTYLIYTNNNFVYVKLRCAAILAYRCI